MKRTLLALMAASLITSCSAAPSDPTAVGNRPGDFTAREAIQGLRYAPERWELNAQEGTASLATTYVVGLHSRYTVEICYLDEATVRPVPTLINIFLPKPIDTLDLPASLN